MAVVLQALLVLVLIGAANTAPLVLKKWLGARFAWPVDGGLRWFDGRPLLGHAKTVRGLAAGVLVPALLAPLLGHAWQHGAAIGAAAMAGDLVSSFCKRRLNRPPSSQVIGLDQIPEVLLPLWIGRAWFDLSAVDVALVLFAFVALQLILSRLFFRLKLRDEPY
jgi:CDP-2,3-bis-(O-geranylgeranyl)-sn-glycerol synthase